MREAGKEAKTSKKQALGGLVMERKSWELLTALCPTITMG